MITVFTVIFTILLVLVGPHGKKPSPPPPSPPVVPTPPKPPIPVPPKPVVPKPGESVEWMDFQPLKTLSNPSWGDVLTDIENHLDPKMGTQYRFSDKDTWAHETTHGIHSYLNNNFARKVGSYGLYVGKNKAVLIKQPKIRLSTIAGEIKKAHKKSRYHLYFIQQQKDWETEPLYAFDEWVAYVNGAECSAELVGKGLYKPNKNDSTWGALEFSVYAIYVCMTTEKYDASYDKKQLLEFTAWNVRRAMKTYTEGIKHDVLNWDDNKYLKELQTGDESKALREYVIKTWGKEYAKEVLGFE